MNSVAGLSERESAAVDRLDSLATLMDSALPVPGTRYRVGLDALLGLVPAVGDAVTAAIACYLVLEAWRLGVSWWTLGRMLGNVGLDFLVGSVPVAGDLFDVGFKANRRNVDLLRAALAGR